MKSMREKDRARNRILSWRSQMDGIPYCKMRICSPNSDWIIFSLSLSPISRFRFAWRKSVIIIIASILISIYCNSLILLSLFRFIHQSNSIQRFIFTRISAIFFLWIHNKFFANFLLKSGQKQIIWRWRRIW